MKRNETDSKKNQLHLFRFVSFLRDGDSVSLCSVSLQKNDFRFVPVRKNSCIPFRSFSFRYCFVSFPFRFGKIWRVFRFISFRFKPFLFESVPFRSVPFLLNVRGFPFRTVSLLSNLFRFVLFPDNIYRFLFPSVPFHKFCLSCCSDATYHIQHSWILTLNTCFRS